MLAGSPLDRAPITPNYDTTDTTGWDKDFDFCGVPLMFIKKVYVAVEARCARAKTICRWKARGN